jgi:hypothetical protein
MKKLKPYFILGGIIVVCLALSAATSFVLAVNGGTGEAGTITGIPYANGTSAYTAATTAQINTLIGYTPAPSLPYLVKNTYVSPGGSTLASVTSPAITVAAGDIVVVFCRSNGTPTADVASSTPSNSFTPLTIQQAGSSPSSQMSYSSVAAASTTFTCTPSVSEPYIGMVVMDLRGSSLTSTVNTSTGNTKVSATNFDTMTLTTTQRTAIVDCGTFANASYAAYGLPLAGPYPATAIAGDSASLVTLGSDECGLIIAPSTFVGNVSIGPLSAAAAWSGSAVAFDY